MPAPPRFALQAATAHDFEALLALRLRAMRPSLERLGRYDEQRIRHPMAQGFEAAHTHHVVVDGRPAGFVSLKTLSHAMRLTRVDHPPHAYLAGSFFQLEDGLIFAIDEYGATAEYPPPCRREVGLAGWQRMKPEDDPREHAP